jgi:hypothetical protein
MSVPRTNCAAELLNLPLIYSVGELRSRPELK